ncbi:unnamed protein product [Dovyalis caffra]|uniref:Uncharacterized protein n=1 Tax=Dovyalis caffra TaxID=77055 RepID=A0AAV1RRS6_9ROSI|nr:unnamed protein product [Dovyalis caffra]
MNPTKREGGVETNIDLDSGKRALLYLLGSIWTLAREREQFFRLRERPLHAERRPARIQRRKEELQKWMKRGIEITTNFIKTIDAKCIFERHEWGDGRKEPGN